MAKKEKKKITTGIGAAVLLLSRHGHQLLLLSWPGHWGNIYLMSPWHLKITSAVQAWSLGRHQLMRPLELYLRQPGQSKVREAFTLKKSIFWKVLCRGNERLSLPKLFSVSHEGEVFPKKIPSFC